MAKQTATYGIWIVNRNDDGKVEIFKNGQLVDNNSAAFREIAAELGMDIDPEWRGSQLRAAVMKAMQNAGDEAPQKVPEKAPEKVEVIPADHSMEKPATKYDVNSIENSEDFCKNNPDLKAFYSEWKTYDKSQWEELLKEAENGDAIAQYKCGYILAYLSNEKFTLEVWGWKISWAKESQALLDHYANIFDLSNMTYDANKWLRKSANQGFGRAMFELGDHYLHGPQCDIVEAVHWKDKSKEVNPWREDYNLYCNFAQVGQRGVKDYPILRQEKERGADIEERKDYWINRCEKEEAKNASLNYYIEELEQKLKKAQAEVSAARSSSSSSYSSFSSSRSSSDDNVKVEIKYKSQIKENGLTFPKTKVVTMTNAEYRSLRDGSMKARIAYVNSHCGIMTFAETVSDVSVSLA